MEKQVLLQEVETKMKIVVIEDFNIGPVLKEILLPSPGLKEVLIKIEYAPITPFERMQCSSRAFTCPFLLGSEASGTIVSVGSEAPPELMGKKVLVSNFVPKVNFATWQGVWAQYVVKDYTDFFMYDQSIPHEIACQMYYSPLTALGLMREIKKLGAKAVVLNPGASTISKILTRVLKKLEIAVFSVVRSEVNVKVLKEISHGAVLNTAESNFEILFNEMIKAHNPTVLVDAVGDTISAKIFQQMPNNSVHIVYGNLSNIKQVNLEMSQLIYTKKSIKGFCFSYEEHAEPKKEIFKDLESISKDLKMGGDLFGTKVVREYKLKDFKQAIEEQPKYASKGRTIIRFHEE
eukprot:TRINITY_DN149_c1_g1_i3.p2 TRINITY_DN149_c1_g1~~TRINITY_DN149_c1_g1_i3.p2  ORF type:complete len:348 (-),score=51.59 TRINITY_DN149_c1_g1_i3:2261-3304(-)